MRQMSGSRLEREAQPSSETVHHIVKAEVHAEVSALQAEMSSMNDKLDRLLSSMIHA